MLAAFTSRGYNYDLLDSFHYLVKKGVGSSMTPTTEEYAGEGMTTPRVRHYQSSVLLSTA